MSDFAVAVVLGSLLWLAGGAGLVVSLVSGATLFAPFAGALILFGAWMTLYGLVTLLRS
jgi:hypothetical protein